MTTRALSAVLCLLAATASWAFVVAPLTPSFAAARCSAAPTMLWRGANGIPKGKVPDTKGKGDDKSWGLYEWLSDNLGGGSDGLDTGPKFGKGASAKGSDANGNFKGDRRVFSNKGKKTANDGVKFNPLDASTW